MNNEIKILVSCHKPCKLPSNSIYLPIHVGKKISKYDMMIQTDCEVNGRECDNISVLNPFYCEMTAMYWAWKNIRKIYPNVKYIGLCHYRRYFRADTMNSSTRVFLGKVKSLYKIISGYSQKIEIVDLSETIKDVKNVKFEYMTKKLIKLVPNYDILYTQPVKYINTDVETHFNTIGRDYISIMRKIIENDYTKYLLSFDNVMEGKELPAANMIILQVDYLDDYCEFIFGVLDRYNKKLIFDKYITKIDEKIYSRIPGYLSELLTATYIKYNQKNKLRTKVLGKYFVQS